MMARDAVILNADDPNCLAMAKKIDGAEVCLISLRADSEAVEEHLAGGGRAVFLVHEGDDEILSMHDGTKRSDLMTARDIPATYDGLARHNIFNALAAAALAWEMGTSPRTIKGGLERFESSLDKSLGRLNMIRGRDYDLLIDQAHNPHGLQAFIEFTGKLPVVGSKIVIFKAGDRGTDDRIRSIARTLAGHFDFYITHDPIKHHERDPGILSKVLAETLVECGVSEDRIRSTRNFEAAAFEAKQYAKPGDLVCVLASLSGSSARELAAQTLELLSPKDEISL
jgi:cyanophycin synthetase